MAEPVTLRLSEVEYDPDYFPRAEIDLDDTVPRYVEALVADPAFDFPAVVVVRRPPGRNPPYLILDGVHRTLGYRQAGRLAIPAVVEHLPPSQWFARSVELNAAHGRPLAIRDRGKIVRRLEADGWQIERIAALLKVQTDSIAPLRANAARMATVTAHPKFFRVPGTAPAPMGGTSSPVGPTGLPLTSSVASPGAHHACRVLDGAIRVLASGEADPSYPEVRGRLVRVKELILAFDLDGPCPQPSPSPANGAGECSTSEEQSLSAESGTSPTSPPEPTAPDDALLPPTPVNA